MGIAPFVFSLCAAVVSVAFAAVVWQRFVARKRASELAWASGLTLYAFASFAEVIGGTSGWSVELYRGYYAAASILVGLLGLGTAFLLGKRTGWVFGILILILAVGVTVGQYGVAVDTAALAKGGAAVGAAGLPKSTIAYASFVLLGIAGGLMLIGGGLWGWWKARAPGLLLIALGGLLASSGGSLEGLGIPGLRIVGNFVAVVAMFAGFLLGRRPAGGRAQIEATRPAAPLTRP